MARRFFCEHSVYLIGRTNLKRSCLFILVCLKFRLQKFHLASMGNMSHKPGKKESFPLLSFFPSNKFWSQVGGSLSPHLKFWRKKMRKREFNGFNSGASLFENIHYNLSLLRTSHSSFYGSELGLKLYLGCNASQNLERAQHTGNEFWYLFDKLT